MVRSLNPNLGSYRYVVIAGPTGSGKSALAMALAPRLSADIVTCDSVQVYRGFDLGAAKPSQAEQSLVPHHLLDIRDGHEDFDAGTYADTARLVIAAVRAARRVPLVVGGTGLYLRALLGQGWHQDLPKDDSLRSALAKEATPELWARLQQLDPERALAVHAHDRVRILRSLELITLLGSTLAAAGLTAKAARDPSAFIIVLEPPRPELRRRIAERTRAMLAAGLIAEVELLLRSGVDPMSKPMQSIGYKQVVDYLAGHLDVAQLSEAIMTATNQYAKRQCTWFRKLSADLRLHGGESIDSVMDSLVKVELFNV